MDDANQRIADAPLPTKATLRARSSLSHQVVRFMAFNLKMLRVVRKGHHDWNRRDVYPGDHDRARRARPAPAQIYSSSAPR